MQKPLSLEAALTQVSFYTGLDLDADDIRSLYKVLKVNRKDTAIFKYLKKANHPLGVELDHMPGDKNWWDKVRADIAKADDDPYPEEAPGSSQHHIAHDRNAVIWWLERWILPVLDPGLYPVKQAIAASEDEVQKQADAEPPPSNDYDARTRVIKRAVARRGQPKFRAKLMNAYSGQCAVTGYEAEAALEAAHLRPYRGPKSNTLSNGLLLRADIHTLLDLGLLAFNPQTREVVVSQFLAGTQYASLSGTPLAEPVLESQRPSQDALDTLWLYFAQAESNRAALGRPASPADSK
jgi:HNH endonuclease